MRYAVVIVTYNRLALLKECIECVRNQKVPFEWILINDNASTDGTVEYLHNLEKEDKRMRVTYQNENLGGSGGFRAGIEQALELDADYVLIIDDDAMLEGDFLKNCDDYISLHEGTPALSGTVTTDGKIQLNHRRTISNMLIFAEKNVPLEQYEKETFKYELSTFCGLMVKMSVLREIGLPMSEFFIWYDDTEFSMRLRKYGGIVNVNSALINHKTKLTQDSGGFYERMNWKTYYGHRNRYTLIKKHCPKSTLFMANLEYYVFILGAALKGRKDLKDMLTVSMHDAKEGKLGKNSNYLPGKK